MVKKYTTISIPYILVLQIDEVLEKYGYRSRSEFSIDAIRRLLEELRMKEKRRK